MRKLARHTHHTYPHTNYPPLLSARIRGERIQDYPGPLSLSMCVHTTHDRQYGRYERWDRLNTLDPYAPIPFIPLMLHPLGIVTLGVSAGW